MPAVLVHGVPDTTQLWDGVRAHLSRTDIVTPALPGFAHAGARRASTRRKRRTSTG